MPKKSKILFTPRKKINERQNQRLPISRNLGADMYTHSAGFVRAEASTSAATEVQATPNNDQSHLTEFVRAEVSTSQRIENQVTPNNVQQIQNEDSDVFVTPTVAKLLRLSDNSSGNDQGDVEGLSEWSAGISTHSAEFVRAEASTSTANEIHVTPNNGQMQPNPAADSGVFMTPTYSLAKRLRLSGNSQSGNDQGNVEGESEWSTDDDAASQSSSVRAESEGSNKGGRPIKRRGGVRKGSGARTAGDRSRMLKSAAANTPITTKTSARRIEFKGKHLKKIYERMNRISKDFQNEPWPREKRKGKNAQKLERCMGEDDECPSMDQCIANAQACAAVDKYVNTQKNRGDEFLKEVYFEENIPKLNGRQTARCHKNESEEQKHIKCASIGANHQVDYYSSGQFGDAVCDHCPTLLLNSEAKAIHQGKVSKCCCNGQLLTNEMQKDWEELQNPPQGLNDLVRAPDPKKREAFLNNTMPLNNSHSFASVHSERAPIEQLGGRRDTIKVNGQFSFCFSDLVAPNGQQPKFAQVYTLSPEDAVNLREKNLCRSLRGDIGKQILRELDKMMRDSPFGKTFVTAGDQIEKAVRESGGQIPRFQITLVTDREMKNDAIKNLPGCTIVERADAPTAEQIAVIWVSEDGLAPDVRGVWIKDQAGRMTEMKNWMPQLDPACFPLLHPRATPGWRWFMKKRAEKPRGKGTTQIEFEIEGEQEIELDGEEFGQNFNHDLDRDGPEDEVNQNEDTENGELEEDEEPMDVDLYGRDVIPLTFQKPKKTNKRENISERQFYLFRFAIRLNKDGTGGGKNDFHWLWFSRRLAEFYVISILNRIERNQLDQMKKQQMKYPKRKIVAKEFKAALEQNLHKKYGGKLGRIFQMNKGFPGSTQYYQEKYANLMSIVQNKGNPTWFVTFTGNPKWPEIVRALQDGQQYTHRADIVCRIFIDKAEEFIHDIIHREVLGKVGGWCYSLEHQKRGMPHIHFLLILDEDHQITTPEQVDQYVCARIPPLPKMDDFSPEAMQQRRLWHTVVTCMLHDCNPACGGNDGKCRKYFPKDYSDHTILSAERYTQYVRLDPEPNEDVRDDDDVQWSETGPDADHHEQIKYRRLKAPENGLSKNWNEEGLKYFRYTRKGGSYIPITDDRVIPYNPYFLLKFGCHINIEYVFGQKACKYIFKYILKGFEKAYVKVVQKDDNAADGVTYDYDEPAAYLKVRYMTAMEAMMRMYSYKIVNMSHQIYLLTVHEPDGQNIIIDEDQEEDITNIDDDTRLTGFFNLCMGDAFARTLRYDQVPFHYTWNSKLKSWTKRKYPQKAKMFVRVYSVSPNRPELLAIRTLLLYRVGPTSFTDLRTVNGEVCATFMEAAQKLGLLESDEIFVRAMKDACGQFSNQKKLCRYFATLLCHACPSDPAKLFDQFLDMIYPAPIVNNSKGEVQSPLSEEVRRTKILCILEYYLRNQGTSCSDLGIQGLPANYNFDKEAEEIEYEALQAEFYGMADRKISPQKIALDNVKKLNRDQRAAFDQITKAISERKGRGFFVQGAGGCGKTFLYNTLIKWCLSGKPTKESLSNPEIKLQRSSVITAASTGIAGLLLIGGSTAHRQFFVPNNVNEQTAPRVNYESVMAQKFREAELIVIDEVGMLHKNVFNYIDRLLRDVCNSKEPFGGKIVLLGGDWKQLTPVVPGGSRLDQVRASIKMDPLFKKHFTTLRLTQNMRAAPNEIKLCKLLMDIGMGMENGRRSDRITVAKANQAQSLEEIIDFCFPAQMFDKPLEHADFLCNSALLCPRNEDVEFINNLAIERMQGQIHAIESIDKPLKRNWLKERNDTFNADANIETIHRETPSGLPPHVLNLKVGAAVMLIRNLDTSQGLCNGTRLQIKKITHGNLVCNILTGPKAGTEVILPPTKFEYGSEEHHRGLSFQRIQFPIRLCFGMTVNKAQGQTLKRMGLVLNRHQCFAHGQVYVAMSRVTSLDGIKVFSQRSDDGQMLISNIVYHELLDELPAPERQPKVLNIDCENFVAPEEEENFDDYFD